MKISIILKTWNALPYVKVCLESLFSKTLMPFELIIIDNNSSKDLKDYLKSVEKNNKNVKLICNCENIGPAQSNILGLSEASGDFICLIDSDLLFSHNWLKKLFETMIDKSFHIVVPMKYHESIMYPFEQSISSRAKWFKIKNEFPTLNPMDQFYKYSKGLTIEKFETQLKLFAPDRPIVLDTPPDFTSSCCMLLERNFLESSGGISDPVFSQYGSEDIDLCWRIGCNGGQIAKLPDVYIHHFHNSSLLANKVDVRLLLRKSNKILYTKWKEYLFELIISKSNSELELRNYLGKYFIFEALSKNTSFIADLQSIIPNVKLPNNIQWRSVYENNNSSII